MKYPNAIRPETPNAITNGSRGLKAIMLGFTIMNLKKINAIDPAIRNAPMNALLIFLIYAFPFILRNSSFLYFAFAYR